MDKQFKCKFFVIRRKLSYVILLMMNVMFFSINVHAQNTDWNTTGNIGIGTTSPTRLLQVEGASGAPVYIIRNLTGSNGNGSSLLLTGKSSESILGPGLGTSINFSISNSYGVTNQIGLLGYVRGNADNYGSALFYTANGGPPTEKMRLRFDGNLGIGTTNPVYKFHVETNNDSHHPTINLRNISSGQNAQTRINFFNNVGTTLNSEGASISYLSSSAPEGLANSFHIWNHSNGDFRIGTNNTERVRVLSNGNVGIGTTNPTAALDIEGGAKMKLLELQSGTSDGARLVFYSEGYPDWRIRNFNGLSFFNGEGQPATMVLANDGKVGIGTQYPQATLSVNGDIFSKKVKVTQSGWADFVFYPDYDLRPLSTLKNFIQINGHLPDVPSQAEVEKDGQDLGR